LDTYLGEQCSADCDALLSWPGQEVTYLDDEVLYLPTQYPDQISILLSQQKPHVAEASDDRLLVYLRLSLSSAIDERGDLTRIAHLTPSHCDLLPLRHVSP
jgi:hypothetical protein